MCASVVTAQVQCREMTAEEILESLHSIYTTLASLNRADGQAPESALKHSGETDRLATLQRNPHLTIQQNSVMCLECGRQFRLLSNRHLALHGLTPRDYKLKWGIPLTTSLSSRTLTTRRRKQAKEKGMGKGLADWRAQRRQQQIA